jgi:DNA-binding IclR family transcriptional regulator
MRDDCGRCEGTASAVVLLDQLADQRRLTILWHLAQGGKTTDELVAVTGLDLQAVAEEVRNLRDIGFVMAAGPHESSIHVLADRQVERVIVLLDEIFG